MATLEAHRARLANGRHLVRIATGIFWTTGILMLGGCAALWVAINAGRLPADSPLAIIWLILITTGMLAFFTLGYIGQRMIKHSLDIAVAASDPVMPDVLRIGPAHPLLQSVAAAAILLGVGIGAPFLLGPKSWWFFGPAIGITLAAMAWLGPAFVGVFSAFLDSSGIRLLELGVYVPWTSVSRLEISRRGIRLVLDGPTSATGEVGEIWTRRAIRRLETEGSVELVTNQPEKLIWFAQRHHDDSQR
jgi:hypothetical protein